MWPSDTPDWPTEAFADLFSDAGDFQGTVADRFGLVDYGNAIDRVVYPSQKVLPTLAVGGEAFLQACAPDEWAELQAKRQQALASYAKHHPLPRVVVMYEPGDGDGGPCAIEDDEMTPEQEAEILRALGLTVAEARARCVTMFPVGDCDGI